MATAVYAEGPRAAHRLRGVRDASIISAVYSVALLVVSGFPRISADFPLDDSWIHQVVARNLAEYHTIGFVPGVWSSGSSSLLWTLILAAKWIAAPALSPVIYCGTLNLFLLICIGIGMLAIARRDGIPQHLCWLMALTPAMNGNFIWLGTTGMEHLLFVALSIAGIYFWLNSATRSAILAALCLGALSLTRPEGAALAVILALVARRSRKDVFIVIAIVSACVLAFALVNLKTAHSLLPLTYAGRKWLYFGGSKIPARETLRFPMLDVLSILHPWDPNETNMLLAFPFALMVAGMVRLFRFKRSRLLCVWMLALVTIYAVMLPSLFDEGRYQSMFLCLMLPLEFIGLEPFIARINSKSVRNVVLTALCVMCAAQSLFMWRGVTRAGVNLVHDTHERAAEFIAKSLPADSRVAALDIGAISYKDGADRVIDIGGLTDSSYMPYLERQRIMAYLDVRHVSYLMWVYNPDGTSDLPNRIDIAAQFRGRVEPLAHFCATPFDWHLVRYHAQCQVIYRIKNIP